jgi:hypothetical protein
MSDQRGRFRNGVRRKGFLRRHGETTICEIHDLTEKGLQIVNQTPLTKLVEHLISDSIVRVGSIQAMRFPSASPTLP